MIEGVFGFHDRVVREVMVPRVDMVAIDQSASLKDLLDLIRDKGHSRLPIYRESLDHIQGIVYVKDLLQILVSRSQVDLATPIDQLLTSQQEGDLRFTHEPYYIPETKKIDVLLNDLRANKIRLAIVLDEYGRHGWLGHHRGPRRGKSSGRFRTSTTKKRSCTTGRSPARCSSPMPAST